MNKTNQSAILSLFIPLLFLFICYMAKGVEEWLPLTDFSFLGIYPRHLRGLAGILFHPFIHGSWGHLLANTLPVLILTWCMSYFYKDWGVAAFFFIWIFEGVLTFLIGKPGWHIGASGIIYGCAFFLFFSGLLRRHVPLVAISLLVTFLYGGIVWNMLPELAAPSTSWEAHLSGALVGTIFAVLFRHKGPQPPRPFWENEQENGEDEDEDENNKSSSETIHHNDDNGEQTEEQEAAETTLEKESK